MAKKKSEAKSLGMSCENCGCGPEWHKKVMMWTAGKTLLGLLLLLPLLEPMLGIYFFGPNTMKVAVGLLGAWFLVKGVKKIARGGCC